MNPHRIFACDPDGQLLAEITFPFSASEVVNINHTYVHPALRGQQIADTLIPSGSCRYPRTRLALYPHLRFCGPDGLRAIQMSPNVVLPAVHQSRKRAQLTIISCA